MAAHVPAALKAADLTRFVVRASQLEKVKPIVAYWCEYWIVNQILSKGLHNNDAETLQYTTTLMDKLEQIKSENASNDAIIDDTAGQAYVEQFGLETFQRADRAVQADKVTKQTADTFQAAATFLELLNIWGTPDAEIQTKIRFAKWNAVRIVKALKEGKDPNETNPKAEHAEEESLPVLDPNDPEVQRLGGSSRQPSVVEVPDEQDRMEADLAHKSVLDQSLHPSAQASARGSPGPTAPPFDPYPRDGFPYTAVQDDNVSPMEPSPSGRDGSVGGGYFPEIPSTDSGPQDSTHQSAPPDNGFDLDLSSQSATSPGFQPTQFHNQFQPSPQHQGPPAAPPQDFYRQVPPPQSQSNYHPVPPSHYNGLAPQEQPVYHPAPPQHTLAPAPPSAQAPLLKSQLKTDDVAIAKAQKHARWAISALNFEDAETAVKELRAALQTLGAG